jgi:hypothetical protein
MNNFYIKRAEYVQVDIPANNTKQTIYFPDLPNLRTSKVFGIETYTADSTPVTNTGSTVQAFTDCKNVMLSLYFDGGDFIQVPLISVYRNNTTTFYGNIPMLAGQVIVWAKSYVFMSGTIGNFAGKSFLFSVYYSKNNI